ncbi:Calmodulin [Exaiptasia diaphana]|nr:Calmodulin [Exaiptasia diaphana]
MTSDDEEFYARDFSVEDEKESNITEENIREFTKAFNDFDVNGDGLLSAAELGTIMRSVGHNPTPKELQDMIASADLDGNGFIDLPEFIKMMSKKNEEDSTEQHLRDAFSLFDKDENGLISGDELKFVLDGMGCNITDDSIEDMIKEADIDGDGCINFEGKKTTTTT